MIQVVVDDLAFVAADAVVRPATSRLEPTQSALRRLEELAGPAFHQQLEVRDELAVGAAVVTGGGDLSAEFVIHAIIRSATEPVTGDGVRRALVSVLHRADAWQLHHLALPPIGTGAGNLSAEEAAAELERALAEVASTAHPKRITVVVESEEDRIVYERALAGPPR